MYSMITLAVGRFEVDWTRYWGTLRDYRELYQTSDVDQVPCYYLDLDEDADDYEPDGPRPTTVRRQTGYSKRFTEVLDRMSLLGYSYESCKSEFEFLARVHDFDHVESRFDELALALQGVDVTKGPTDYGDHDESCGEFFRRYIAPRISLNSWKNESYRNFSEAMEAFDPRNVLLLLSTNPTIGELNVDWDVSRYQDCVEGLGDNIVGRPEPANRFLIVTEGSSDAKIIKRSFDILMPHIADFFDYVDMEERYPFTGTGNLVNFVRGLISISIHNNVVVVFDNDAEGVAAHTRCMDLNIPGNMKIIKLPDRPEFNSFKTVGPNGTQNANINGKAAAIECYLDLDQNASVKWLNLNTLTNSYHGQLVDKGKYSRSFLEAKKKTPGYNYSKISSVLDAIIEQCCHIKKQLNHS